MNLRDRRWHLLQKITQGSIIYGVRSSKYPTTRCYGIIISARCDVANRKIQKLYYLVAADAQDWFLSDVGYNESYAEKIKSCEQKLASCASAHSLDLSSLLCFTESEFATVIDAQNLNKKDKTLIEDAYKKLRLFSCPHMTVDARRSAIKTECKPAENYLLEINKGNKVVHFAYLPQDAYTVNGSKDRGLIVDLQEIGILHIKDAEVIQSPGIDYLRLDTLAEAERLRLKEHFWLERQDDFVMIADNIKSPWTEYLMQRFSHAFIRIGVEGASKSDFSKLVASI
jgi:hypothetical protein